MKDIDVTIKALHARYVKTGEPWLLDCISDLRKQRAEITVRKKKLRLLILCFTTCLILIVELLVLWLT